jgi:hypothetical protein
VRFPVVTFVSPDQHDVLPITDLATRQHFYGTLTDAPHLYAFHVDEPTDVSLALFVPDLPDQKNDMSILVLRKKVRGLDLVARLEAARASWVASRWWSTGDAYRKGDEWSDTLYAGDYEVEVSTPSNRGSYVLSLGTESTTTLSSYTTQVGTLFRIKHFFHKPGIAAVESPLLFVPLMLLCGLSYILFRTYRSRDRVLY